MTTTNLDLGDLGLVSARSLISGETPPLAKARLNLSHHERVAGSEADDSPDNDRDSVVAESNLNNDTRSAIRWSAMGLLARREHSLLELSQKLSKRYSENASLVREVIEELCEENLQSDSRFAEAYVAMRKRKAFGPQRILQELREKGVSTDIAASEVFSFEHDWAEAAYAGWARKFATADQLGLMLDSKPKQFNRSLKEKAKQLRFLQYRGFRQDDYQHFMGAR